MLENLTCSTWIITLFINYKKIIKNKKKKRKRNIDEIKMWHETIGHMEKLKDLLKFRDE